MKYSAEYTDTFSGEANYSWVRRRTFEAPDNASNSLLVRRAKLALGIRGPHRTEEWGETLAVYPSGTCTVLFIEATHEEDEHRMAGRIHPLINQFESDPLTNGKI